MRSRFLFLWVHLCANTFSLRLNRKRVGNSMHRTALEMLVNRSNLASSSPSKDRLDQGVFSSLIWNVGGPQTNPFEFRNALPAAMELQDAVEEGNEKIADVFNLEMVQQLEGAMREAGIPDAQINFVREHYEKLKLRRAVSGFLLDKTLDLGNRRSVAAADIFTGTIKVESGPPQMRPAVINCGPGFSSLAEWWASWLHFMFKKIVKTQKMPTEKPVWELLKSIDLKYFKDLSQGHQAASPDAVWEGDDNEWQVVHMSGETFKAEYNGAVISADPAKDPIRAQFLADQRASVPLQMLHLALFDAITVTSMLRTGKLGSARDLLCDSIRKKDDLTLGILQKYIQKLTPDVITLTEVGFNLENMIKESLSNDYYMVKHAKENIKSSKKSEFNFILLSKGYFKAPQAQPESGGFDVAELLMAPVQTLDDTPFFIAAFHGQSSGSTSASAAEVIWKRAQEESGVLLAGMDANVVNAEAVRHSQFAASTTFEEFNGVLTSNGLATSSTSFAEACMDTCNKVRSVVNTQLQKAVCKAQWKDEVDKNPKDHTIFSESQLRVLEAAKYNTPDASLYQSELVFPTLVFPADHAIVYTRFQRYDRLHAGKGITPGRMRSSIIGEPEESRKPPGCRENYRCCFAIKPDGSQVNRCVDLLKLKRGKCKNFKPTDIPLKKNDWTHQKRKTPGCLDGHSSFDGYWTIKTKAWEPA